MKQQTHANMTERVRELQERIEELEETLRAIRMGEVDAVLVSSPAGAQVFTLQGAEHPYRLLVETIDEGAATLSDDGTVLYSNKSFAAIFNVPLEKFIGAELRDFVSREDMNYLSALIEQAKKDPVRGEIHLKTGKERPRTIRLTLSPNRDLGVDTICAVATELTELLETNEALRVTEVSLRQLSARLLQLQDEERRRIARDLHDTTGQKIAVLSMALDRLGRMIDPRKRRLKETLEESREFVRAIGEEIRTVSYLLHPPLLDECGLASAVRWYAEGFQQRSGIRTEVKMGEGLTRLPAEVETALFRVVQESLTNVHRYSGSPDAEISIAMTQDRVQLEIVDHGKGKVSAKARGAVEGTAALGVGIPGMRERVRQLGGQLYVDFGTNGTRIAAVLPLTKNVLAMPGAHEERVVAPVKTRETQLNLIADHDTRMRILIADDHEVMRRGLRGLIESQVEWAICGEAVEGREAVQMAEELKPDLVILDVNMPSLSGIDAAAQILRKNSGTKILFFTVHDSDQMMREIANIGAQGYVAKSRAGQDLVDAVRSVLGGGSFFPAGSSVVAARRSA